ncbi:DUF4426 domain-containing protein [Permianibacter sp. IMCC34836]|uniref:DUF4426 domain-containing protein n=1 Tax=Permianibacter fluminis TaxID=2738515 RepID=UPI0015531D88|nr:DUF4426 domain-containing protein [Permianibacter fluminis]NQD35828.1 DUF4426 domain-containing protein [Permianibacter fluminis]
MWRHILTAVAVLAAVLGTGSVAAEQVQVFGDYEVHYNALNSSALSPAIAKQYGLTRGGNQGLINIAVRKRDGKDGTAVAAKVSGDVKNLLSQRNTLSFKEIKETGAVYYIATFRFDDKDTLTFELNVQPDGDNSSYPLTFNQTLWVQ